MKNQKSLQPPAKCNEASSVTAASIEECMQQWLDNAQRSNDARDRIAVVNGISRGVFGALHLGAVGEQSDQVSDCSDQYCDDDYEELKRAA